MFVTNVVLVQMEIQYLLFVDPDQTPQNEASYQGQHICCS